MFRNFKRRNRGVLKSVDKTPTSKVTQDTKKYYRCRVCGHICNSENVVSRTDGYNRDTYEDGNSYTVDAYSEYSVEASEDSCPLCGTYYSR